MADSEGTDADESVETENQNARKDAEDSDEVGADTPASGDDPGAEVPSDAEEPVEADDSAGADESVGAVGAAGSAGTNPQQPAETGSSVPAERAGASNNGEPARHAEQSHTDENRQEYTTLRGRIAAGIRESSPLSRVRDFIFPLLTLCILAFLLLSFRTILLPFIFACILVYLMEPIVRRVGHGPDGGGYVPRWVAVIFVYLIFIGTVGTFSFLVIPRFVTEIIRFAETVPEVVQDFRENDLPGIDAEVQEFLRSYVPDRQGVPDHIQAHHVVAEARLEAARQATAMSAATSYVDHAASTEFRWRVLPSNELPAVGPAPDQNDDDPKDTVQIDRTGESGTSDSSVSGLFDLEPPGAPPEVLTLDDALATGSGWAYEASTNSSIKLVPSRDGGVEVFLSDVAIQVEQTDDNVWTIRETAQDEIPIDNRALAIEQRFNLQRTLDEIIGNLVTTSNARIASVIDFAQKIVVGIVGGFVAIVLTLMVAAFISIDLPRVMSFLRSLVPARAREGYDVLLKKMDRGLAGVVRGQLLICLVNGILTYVGLLILDVKFSVLLGVVAGVLSLIPVFGTIISTIPIVLIGMTDGFLTGVLALGWILLIHFVEANILNPKIIGSSAHIHPVIVIFALLAGESAFGLVGALLAVPTASILLTLFEFVRTRAWREGLSDDQADTA